MIFLDSMRKNINLRCLRERVTIHRNVYKILKSIDDLMEQLKKRKQHKLIKGFKIDTSCANGLSLENDKQTTSDEELLIWFEMNDCNLHKEFLH